MRMLLMSLVVAGVSTVPAAAQSRFGVGALGGVASSDGTSSPIWAGQAHVRAAPHLIIIGEIARIHDVLPSSVRRLVAALGRLDALENGTTGDLEGRLSATTFAGGARWMFRSGGWSPFAEAQLGATRVAFDVSGDNANGSFASDVRNEIRTDDVDTGGTHLSFNAGGGITVPLSSRIAVAGGYRFMRIRTESGISIHTGYGAVTFAF